VTLFVYDEAAGQFGSANMKKENDDRAVGG
jgi:hypothetical protein